MMMMMSSLFARFRSISFAGVALDRSFFSAPWLVIAYIIIGFVLGLRASLLLSEEDQSSFLLLPSGLFSVACAFSNLFVHFFNNDNIMYLLYISIYALFSFSSFCARFLERCSICKYNWKYMRDGGDGGVVMVLYSFFNIEQQRLSFYNLFVFVISCSFLFRKAYIDSILDLQGCNLFNGDVQLSFIYIYRKLELFAGHGMQVIYSIYVYINTWAGTYMLVVHGTGARGDVTPLPACCCSAPVRDGCSTTYMT